MINKQNMWFLTLFSLVLILSVYYITMPNELLITNSSNTNTNSVEATDKEEENSEEVVITEASAIETMKVENDTEVQETIKELEQTLTSMDISTNDKNKAYEELQSLNKTNALEETIESIIKDKYGYEVFVKIKSNQVRVVVGSKEGTTELANEIMRLVQEQFEDKVYISVQFSV
jgi:stage III sporulation protein AH